MSRSGPRRASIKFEDYTPKKGDLLDDFELGITFECRRVDTWIDEKTGQKFKYGVLVAYPDFLEGMPLVRTFLSGSNEQYLGDLRDMIDGSGIQRIRRERTARNLEGGPVLEIREYTFEWDAQTRSAAYVYVPGDDI